MSLYMSSHKKKKSFPFSLFGFISLLGSVGLTVYIWQTGTAAADFFGFGPDDSIRSLLGFSLMVFAFLNYFLSLGIAAEIHGKFKFPLYLVQILFFIMIGTTGYFTNDSIFPDLVNYLMATGFAYFLILMIYLIFQRRAYSRYYSIAVMIITCLPLIPFAYGLYRFIAEGSNDFADSFWAFDNIAIYVLLFTMLFYTIANSFYLFYINRKVY